MDSHVETPQVRNNNSCDRRKLLTLAGSLRRLATRRSRAAVDAPYVAAHMDDLRSCVARDDVGHRPPLPGVTKCFHDSGTGAAQHDVTAHRRPYAIAVAHCRNDLWRELAGGDEDLPNARHGAKNFGVGRIAPGQEVQVEGRSGMSKTSELRQRAPVCIGNPLRALARTVGRVAQRRGVALATRASMPLVSAGVPARAGSVGTKRIHPTMLRR